jgi:hypothetical protein
VLRIVEAQNSKDSELIRQLSRQQQSVESQLQKATDTYQRLAKSMEGQIEAVEAQRRAEAREFQKQIAQLTDAIQSGVQSRWSISHKVQLKRSISPLVTFLDRRQLE